MSTTDRDQQRAHISNSNQDRVRATTPSSQSAQQGTLVSSSTTGTAQQLTSDGKLQSQGLRLLSLDGGGIRGLSELIILREILQRIKNIEKLPEVPLPCEYFDLIGGTSTGGLIALLLGRLRLPVQVAIDHYDRFAGEVFSQTKWRWKDGTFSATKLEEVVKGIMERSDRDPEERMLDPGRDYEVCNTFVCAMPAFQISKHPRLFRTYPAPKHEGDNCPIWQAARATSAAPTFFKRIKIGREEFIDGGMGCNNPTGEVLEEAKLIFPTRSIACILSIGTGKPNVNRLQGPTSFQRVVPTNVINALKGIAIDCEGVAVDIGKRFGETPDVYFRFNVEQGMQNVMLGQWDKLGEVETYTRGYLQDPDVDRKIDAAVNALIERRPIVPTKQIDGMIPSKSSHTAQERLLHDPCQASAGRHEQEQNDRQDKLYHQVISWLACYDANESNHTRHRNNTTKRLEKTSDWLYKATRYLEWYGGNTPIIWLCARPGFGKSTLCSHVIHAINESDPMAAIAYHFYQFDHQQNSANKTLRLLAEQLFVKHWNNVHVVSDEIRLQTQKSVGELHNVRDLIAILVKCASRTYFLIDGLDEESAHSRRTEAQTVLDILVQLTKDFPDSVRLWCSSQERPFIAEKLSKFVFNGNDQITGDVTRYLSCRLPKPDDPELSEEDWAAVVQNLVVKAQGNFLWASLMVDVLKDGELGDLNTMKQFIEKSLPHDLNSYYCRIFARFEKNNPSLASKFFSLVAFARRPLRVKEIREAIGILQSSHPESMDSGAVPIGSAWYKQFTPLIEIQTGDSGDFTCRLCHSTVRTFLLNHPTILDDGTCSPPLRIGHHVIFDACLLYLSQDRYQKLLVKKDKRWVDASGKPTNDHHFLLYSAKYWNKHVPETDAARARVRTFIVSSNFLTCIQAQSLWVESQFLLFQAAGGSAEKPCLRRLFPSWFDGHLEDRSLWRDFRAFMHEWRYLLCCWNCGILQCQMQQYAGEIDRCLWGALGAHNFMSRFAGRYRSFTFQSGDVVTGQCYEGVSASGDELRLLWLVSRHRGELRFTCEHWSLSGQAPPILRKTQSICTDETSTNWLLYVKSSGIDASMRVGRAPPASFSDGCRLLRIGTQIFAEDDAGTYVSLPSTCVPYVEEFTGRGCLVILASRRIVTHADVHEGDIRDAEVADFGADFTKIEENLGVSKHVVSLELDYDGGDDADSERSDASSSAPESDSSGHAYETWSECSSDEADIQFEDDLITPWSDRVVSLRRSTPQLPDTPDISEDDKTADSESSELQEPLPLSAIVGYGRYRADTSSDEDSGVLNISYYSDGDDDGATPALPCRPYGRKNVPTGTRASITVFDMTLPVPTKLFHFTRMLPFVLYGSPPVVHPSEPLVVWPLSRGDLLFANFRARTFFVRKLRLSTAFTRHIFIKCHFSPCGHYLHVASLEGQRKSVSGRRPKKDALPPPLNLALLVLTYRLSRSKPTKSPPSLIYSTRINLGEVTALSVSRLPFTLTWTSDELYLTCSNIAVRVYRIQLFQTSKMLPILVPQSVVFLPNTARMRAVHYFPPGGGSTAARVIIGSEPRMPPSTTDRFFGSLTPSLCVTEDVSGLRGSPSLPIGCYLAEADLGDWIASCDRTEIPTDLGIGRLDHRLERFDPEEDCDLEPYIS